MRATSFPEQTGTLAEDQPEYLPLPVFQDATETISRYELTMRERLLLLIGRPLWLRQLNFGDSLQPQQPTVDRPFII